MILIYHRMLTKQIIFQTHDNKNPKQRELSHYFIQRFIQRFISMTLLKTYNGLPIENMLDFSEWNFSIFSSSQNHQNSKCFGNPLYFVFHFIKIE